MAGRLVRAPETFMHMVEEVRNVVTLDSTAMQLSHAPTGVDNLSPNNRFVKASAALPMVRGVPFHTIIGDRGRGGGAESSDGVVAYWSSHLDGAASERTVPSGHAVHRHPEGIEEVRRILRAAAERR
jgi:hypothetical protein